MPSPDLTAVRAAPNLRAAQIALSDALASAPMVEGGGGGLVINLADTVMAVITAAHADALIPPRYDSTLAAETWHRIVLPTTKSPGMEISFRLGNQGPETWLRVGHEGVCVGQTTASALHQLGLTALSVSMAREGA